MRNKRRTRRRPIRSLGGMTTVACFETAFPHNAIGPIYRRPHERMSRPLARPPRVRLKQAGTVGSKENGQVHPASKK